MHLNVKIIAGMPDSERNILEKPEMDEKERNREQDVWLWWLGYPMKECK